MSESIFLAFDYGTRRIGVAVGDTLTGSARPLATIANGDQPDWRALDKALQEWRPQACVVGLPLDLEGNEQSMTRQARAFSQKLQERFKLPVHLADERHSSRAADDELREARSSGRMQRRVRSGDRDGQAARLILEQWLRDNASRAVPAAVPKAQPGTATTEVRKEE